MPIFDKENEMFATSPSMIQLKLITGIGNDMQFV